MASHQTTPEEYFVCQKYVHAWIMSEFRPYAGILEILMGEKRT
jgi:hypothetical protein